MEREAAREFVLRWRKVAELDRRAQPEPETRLRQLEGLLELARKAGWPVEGPERQEKEVRRRWRMLRSRLHGGRAR